MMVTCPRDSGGSSVSDRWRKALKQEDETKFRLLRQALKRKSGPGFADLIGPVVSKIAISKQFRALFIVFIEIIN
ncbi:MAG TPA: hypothetical protein PLA50_15695 [Bacteroidia bacterium]|nr:hypothetical protein [Bacteroidia bacterium]